jgi:hypothetical protein
MRRKIFFCAVSKVFDRVKTVDIWSAKKMKRTIKGYGSAAKVTKAIMAMLLRPV